MAFTHLLHKQVKKYYNKQEEAIKQSFNKSIFEICKDPFKNGKLLRGFKVKGFDKVYSYRDGSCRILYIIDKENRVVFIVKIDARGDVYKK